RFADRVMVLPHPRQRAPQIALLRRGGIRRPREDGAAQIIEEIRIPAAQPQQREEECERGRWLAIAPRRLLEREEVDWPESFDLLRERLPRRREGARRPAEDEGRGGEAPVALARVEGGAALLPHI